MLQVSPNRWGTIARLHSTNGIISIFPLAFPRVCVMKKKKIGRGATEMLQTRETIAEKARADTSGLRNPIGYGYLPNNVKKVAQTFRTWLEENYPKATRPRLVCEQTSNGDYCLITMVKQNSLEKIIHYFSLSSEFNECVKKEGLQFNAAFARPRLKPNFLRLSVNLHSSTKR